MYGIPFRINLKCYGNEYSTFLPKRYKHAHIRATQPNNVDWASLPSKQKCTATKSEKFIALKMVIQTVHNDSLFSVQWQVASYFVHQYWRILVLCLNFCYTIIFSSHTHTYTTIINRIGYQFYDFHIIFSFYFLRFFLIGLFTFACVCLMVARSKMTKLLMWFL